MILGSAPTCRFTSLPQAPIVNGHLIVILRPPEPLSGTKAEELGAKFPKLPDNILSGTKKY